MSARAECPGCHFYIETIASMSAALLGILQPGQPYKGNPTSVSEAMQVRRALFIVARQAQITRAAGRFDVTLEDIEEEIKKAVAVAEKEIKIIYAPVPTKGAPS